MYRDTTFKKIIVEILLNLDKEKDTQTQETFRPLNWHDQKRYEKVEKILISIRKKCHYPIKSEASEETSHFFQPLSHSKLWNYAFFTLNLDNYQADGFI